MKLLPPDKGGEGRVGERRGRKKKRKGKGGEEDFRAFPQFQIYYYTTASLSDTRLISVFLINLVDKEANRNKAVIVKRDKQTVERKGLLVD